MSELRGLQLSIDEFRETGSDLKAVVVDPVETNLGVAESMGIDFPILSDPDLVAIDAFGLRHAGGSPDGGDIARPAIYLVRDGIVRYRALTDNWRVRMRAEDLLQIVRTDGAS